MIQVFSMRILSIPSFEKAVKKLLTESEYEFLKEMLLMNPKVGIVEPGTNGTR
jgi:hypothetical protein